MGLLALLNPGLAAGAQAPSTTPSPTPNSSAQAPPANSAPPAKTDGNAKPEVDLQDTGTTFKLRVNLVQVRVVVRDSQGKAVENLHREDFQLFDQGKPQAITTFGVETPLTLRQKAEAAAKTQSAEGDPPTADAVALPQRFVALVFDDTHLSSEDANVIRQAAYRFLNIVAPTDRVGIFSTSGQVHQDFTSDKEALRRTLLALIPRALMPSTARDCPNVTHYMADQIENQHNDQAMAVVVEEALDCAFRNDPTKIQAARALAESAVLRELNAGDTENEFTYRHLEDALRRLSAMPGERVLLLMSPGFILSTQTLDESGIVDRANRANIVINTVDARGLYVPDLGGDLADPPRDAIRTAGFKASYRVAAQQAQSWVLMDFAYGTGGTFFHNSNDLDSGLKLAGATPEVSYVLGFSPQNQKMDGRYHALKVTLTSKQKYSIQARRGYYAPRKLDDPQERAREEIQEAVFSQEEIHELPLDLQTQYFRTDDSAARLSVVSRLELRGIHFRKAEGRNFDNLTLATVIFDENGNYVTGGEKIVQMRLLDNTYERLSRTGLTVKSSFQVKPGKYLVRQVVRDSEGAQMAARNGAVVIPF